jgi:predicted nuclease with TOPRIM domain
LQKKEFEQTTQCWTNSISEHLSKVKNMVGEFTNETNQRLSSLEQSQSEMSKLDEEMERILIKRRKILSQSQTTTTDTHSQLSKFSSDISMEIDTLDSHCHDSGKSIVKNFQETFLSHGEETSKVPCYTIKYNVKCGISSTEHFILRAVQSKNISWTSIMMYDDILGC